jgi:hypothetical protein
MADVTLQNGFAEKIIGNEYSCKRKGGTYFATEEEER